MSIRKLGMVFVVLLALSARVIPGPRTVDDAYITFRYARNLLAGQGFTYNPGEYVLGTTTPFYTGLMTGLGAISGGTQAPFPWLALGLNSLADAITCILIWKIGRKSGFEWAGAATALAWAVAPFSVTFAIGGMETSIYVLLLTATMLGYLQRKHTLYALCASLAFLTRPDALILIVPLALDRLVRAIRGEKIHLGEVLAFVIPAAGWYGFAWVYFGTPIPQSIYAKVAVYHLNPSDSFIRMIQHYATPFLEDQTLGSKVAIATGIFLYPFLTIIGALQVWRREPRLFAFILFPWVYFLAFSLPNTLIFRWYLTPPMLPYFFFIFVGAWHLLHRLGMKIMPSLRNRVALSSIPGVLIMLIPLVFNLNAWTLHPDHGQDQPAPPMAWIKLELLYQEVSTLILPELSKNDLLAAGDVGILGFYTSARILDTVGLNSPVSMRYYPLPASQYVSNYAISTDLLIDEKPDWVVAMEIYGRNTFLVDPRFLQQYRLRYTLPTDIYGSHGLLVFQRISPTS